MRLTEKMNVRAIAVKSEMTISTPIASEAGATALTPMRKRTARKNATMATAAKTMPPRTPTLNASVGEAIWDSCH